MPPTTMKSESSGRTQMVLSYQPCLPMYSVPVLRWVQVAPPSVERQISPLLNSREA